MDIRVNAPSKFVFRPAPGPFDQPPTAPVSGFQPAPQLPAQVPTSARNVENDIVLGDMIQPMREVSAETITLSDSPFNSPEPLVAPTTHLTKKQRRNLRRQQQKLRKQQNQEVTELGALQIVEEEEQEKSTEISSSTPTSSKTIYIEVSDDEEEDHDILTVLPHGHLELGGVDADKGRALRMEETRVSCIKMFVVFRALLLDCSFCALWCSRQI